MPVFVDKVMTFKSFIVKKILGANSFLYFKRGAIEEKPLLDLVVSFDVRNFFSILATPFC